MTRYYGQTVLLASAARTATVATGTVSTPDSARGVIVHVDATAASATPSVVFTIQGYDVAADDWYTVLASAAVTGISNNAYIVGEGLTDVANSRKGTPPPPKWRVNCVHGDSDSITYSIAFEFWS